MGLGISVAIRNPAYKVHTQQRTLRTVGTCYYVSYATALMIDAIVAVNQELFTDLVCMVCTVSKSQTQLIECGWDVHNQPDMSIAEYAVCRAA